MLFDRVGADYRGEDLVGDEVQEINEVKEVKDEAKIAEWGVARWFDSGDLVLLHSC